MSRRSPASTRARRWRRHAHIGGLLIGLSLYASTGDAADPKAEALFRDGLAAMDKEEFDAGCKLFASSQAMEPRSGTLMMLAFCHEKQGKNASAWAEYREAVGMARAEGRDKYAEKAEKLAEGLEPNLSRLTISAEVTEKFELEVTIDGDPVPTATLGNALPIDPGEHEVVAAAPGYHSWSETLTIASDGSTQTLKIPALEVDPETANSGPLAPKPRKAVDDGPPLLAAGLAVGGIGLAGVGVGLALGGIALGHQSTIDEQCNAQLQCTPEGLDASDAGGGMALGSTIAVAVGGAALGVGLVLVIVDAAGDDGDAASVADSEAALALQPLPGGGFVSLRMSL